MGRRALAAASVLIVASCSAVPAPGPVAPIPAAPPMYMPGAVPAVQTAVFAPLPDPEPAAAGQEQPPAEGEDQPQEPETTQPPSTPRDWNQTLQQLRQETLVAEQERRMTADEHYRVALGYYERADFERADREVGRALAVQPDHGGALALKRELDLLQDRAPVTPAEQAMLDLRNQEAVRRQQVLIEIDTAMQQGVTAFNENRFDDADERFRTILEYLKWLPTGVDLEQYRRQATDMLERTRVARRQQIEDDERQRRNLIEETRRVEDSSRVEEERRRIELLFQEAQRAFENEEYDETIRICNRLLDMEPRLATVREMRQVAERLRHTKREDENLRAYVEQWKETFMNLDLQSIQQEHPLLWTDRATWENVIQPRRSRRSFQAPEEVSAEDQAILDRLATTVFPYQGDMTLREMADRVQDHAQVSYYFDPNVDPDGESVSVVVRDLPILQVLRIYLGALDPALASEVRGGILHIIPADALMNRVILEIYDVGDITYAPPDFIGIDPGLDQAQQPPPPPPAAGGFTADDLIDIIRQTIEPDAWDQYNWDITAEQEALLATTIPRVHERINDLLNNLRATAGILVNVEARFLTVEDRFLQQVGMDFRDLDRVPTVFTAPQLRQPEGLLNITDVNNAFAIPNRFFDPDGPGPLSANSSGIAGQWGTDVFRAAGARVQNLMFADTLLSRFLTTVWGTAGGLALQYVLVDDVSVSALLKAVEKTGRGHILNAPRLTLFNLQRGHTLVANQLAYIRDWTVNIAAQSIVPDPDIGIANDGISLDVRPTVSHDRRFVMLEMHPTVSVLSPPPPEIETIPTVIGGQNMSDVAAQPGQIVMIEVPTLEVQRLRTTVVIPDRGTLIIGGLGLYFDVDARSSIPMLNRIPIVSFFGEEKFRGRQRRQLLVLVRPEIIIPSDIEEQEFH